MTFDADLQDDLKEVFFKSAAGEGERSCTYLPKAGGTLQFPLRPAKSEKNGSLEDRQYDIIYAEEIPVLINSADLFRPVIGDSLTVEGETWRVTQFERVSFVMWKVYIRKHILPER